MQSLEEIFSELDLEILAAYFWENMTLEFFLKFVILYFIIVWISLIVWVGKDISNRTNSIFFQVFCILIMLVLTPFGIFIYLLIRPGRSVFEKYYEEIEENLNILSDTIASHQFNCPQCGALVNTHFCNCPECKYLLQQPCSGCSKFIFHEWKHCPYCGKKNKQKKKLEVKEEK